MKNLKTVLKNFSACEPAILWADNKTIEEVVKTCERGDWLLWLAKKLDVDLKLLTLTKGYCAQTVIHLMKDERSKKAVEIAIKFGEGTATRDELNAAAAAAAAAAADAYAAYAAAYAAAAAAAADADAYAAYAAAAAADADAYAAYAAYAAAAAAAADADAYAAYAAYAAAAAADARKKNQLLTADICRKYLRQTIIEKVNFLINQ